MTDQPVQEDSSESHGIFQFDDSDDLFEQTPKRNRHVIDTDFAARALPRGWLLGASLDVSARFGEKLGPNQIINGIEILYLQRKYEECLGLVAEFVKHNAARPKPIQIKEICEIGARCCLRLGRNEEALAWIEKPAEPNREPGYYFLIAQIYRLNHHFIKSLTCYREYLHIRSNDYLAWKEIALLFHSIYESKQASRDLLVIAVLSMRYSYRLLLRSPRPSTVFSQANLRKEGAFIESTTQAWEAVFVVPQDNQDPGRSLDDIDVAKVDREAIRVHLNEDLADWIISCSGGNGGYENDDNAPEEEDDEDLAALEG
ncbi:uncharacterized protein BJ171DRAFT_525244 [Polychytrium aggregatum]|uniref:uncharacterized protein n=1 Tax=Polychytrium aggregatum TaxID=110093 RepID=UPI0022FDCBF4|nr:uncharacterized protein BJ171DRAFT_525244 [Polychytrium aggregatum]KAI9193614.1 hypothetical protein BJ171DRAFT_525244 [Polychytrium aggregatum]